MKVGYVASSHYLEHKTGNHPEQPARLSAIADRIGMAAAGRLLLRIDPEPASLDDIRRAHSDELIRLVEGSRGGESGYFDMDTVYSARSADVALLAAGGVMTAVRDVMSGTVDRAFCAVRPPGHHATPHRAMGFCLYNNVAVAARFLLDQYEGIQRVAIIDFDVHHGNGTQDIFYEDPSVFYYSIHQSGIFPGTGHPRERGAGAGEGTTLNVPFSALTPRQEILDGFRQGLDEVFRFKPQFVFISAGFDAHENDPLGMLTLRSADFGTMTRWIVEGARESGARGIVATLEGGYHLPSLAEAVEAHLEQLSKD